MTDRELMQQALDALEEISGGYSQNLIVALRERLAQPEQQPVAHTLNCVCGAVWDIKADGVEEMVHAPNPPQRKPLTDEGVEEICWTEVDQRLRSLARAIEAKLKEKNT